MAWSWNLRMVMMLRDIAWECINVVVGNGKQTSLGYDDWHDVSPSIKVFPPAIIQLFSSTNEAKLSSIIRNGEWAWPKGRMLRAEALAMVQASPSYFLPKPDIKDVFIWKIDPSSIFSVKSALKKLSTYPPNVSWYKGVWGKHYVLEHSFILMLTCRRRLATTNMLLSWGMEIDASCPLCKSANETLSHLFFCYPFSTMV
ncbi:hypothetical protein ACH5RR_026612 [Cinchona calisaya]|uniref:Reverse transcriptase zinc-binding domain-containing protein n=1 Tax=Cinchona calisaya TaxID=153742 RepID=A0ABD2Z6D3_9GENT